MALRQHWVRQYLVAWMASSGYLNADRPSIKIHSDTKPLRCHAFCIESHIRIIFLSTSNFFIINIIIFLFLYLGWKLEYHSPSTHQEWFWDVSHMAQNTPLHRPNLEAQWYEQLSADAIYWKVTNMCLSYFSLWKAGIFSLWWKK